MPLVFRVPFFLAVCLMAITLPAAPAQAECVAWDIELSPESGPPGTEVEIYGHDFADGRPIDIYYDGALVSQGTETDPHGDFTITIRIPDGCGGRYQVHADVGYAEADAYFRVKPGLTVSPDNGPPGTIEGKGFASYEGGIELLYYFNDSYETIETDITADGKGSWEATFVIPTSTRGGHKMDAQGAVSRLYEVEEATFQVTSGISLDKSVGPVGESVMMTGSRFAAYEKGIQILFDGQAVVTSIDANSKGEWEASFLVPDMPAGEYSVTVEGDQTKKEDVGGLSFEIEPDIVLFPAAGHVGMNLTVRGNGFAADEDVNIMYDGGTVETTKTNGQGSFEISFAAPESQCGQHQVAAGYGGENRATAVFIMESNHPDAPALISPSRNGRIGLIGKATPKFEWSPVSDDSGVHYRLQIATSEDFAASSLVASETGLTETSYTLNATQALPQGTYYWAVQAVDGAQNESPWTPPGTFRVGLLPRWGFALIIVAVVVLIGALVRALIRRRAIYYDRW
jgi:hypothetical protein